MVSSETSADQSDRATPRAEEGDARRRVRRLQSCFCVFVVLLAIFQFSENTVDVDLWGHVTFGEAMLKTHSIQKTDIYSWTAAGKPWVNHECLAEIALGGAHALLGGKGLLLLKMAVGLLSFGLALRLGINKLPWPERLAAWALGGLAVVEISYGFAARPQIFTVLFIVFELALLRRIHAGAHLWAIAMPIMFAVWINTHGGVLAGFGLLGLAAAATTAQWIFRKISPGRSNSTNVPAKTAIVLWLEVGASGAALFINPWRGELIRWLIRSVLWLRPEIEEWNPTPLGWDHAVLFALILLAAFAWIFTCRPRAWWEFATCAAFAVLALRSVRNTPLCAIVILALTPPHLASSLVRFKESFARIEGLCSSAGFQKLATALLIAGSAGTAIATFTLHKQNPFTMEIPSARFPNGAVAFLREHDLRGKTLVYFDWGEMVIFHLPDCPPSIDGRLDTCYPPEVIRAHWQFYNADDFDRKALNVDEADLALLPANLAGAAKLGVQPDWKAIYFDDTAVILAHHVERFPQLSKLTLPVKGPPFNGLGRVAFMDQSPRSKSAP
jgi:hypothetical protein